MGTTPTEQHEKSGEIMTGETFTAHDMYNALVAELSGMIKSFERRYCANIREGWSALDLDFFDVMFFLGENGEFFSIEKQKEVHAELDEIKARHKAMLMYDGSESEKAFNAMHDEYLDDLAGV